MKLFLSSEGIPHVQELKQLLRAHTGKPRVAVVHNAQDCHPEVVACARALALDAEFALLGFETLNLDLRTYSGKTKELAEMLSTCELVWCSGGNSFWLRYVMRTSGFDVVIHDLLANGLVYGGWSAGAVVAGPSMHPIEIMDDPQKAPEIIWEGLGLVDTFIWPHWGREKYAHLEEEGMKQMKAASHKTMILMDGEVLVVDEHGQRVIR